jgi:hypothetical protein
LLWFVQGSHGEDEKELIIRKVHGGAVQTEEGKPNK